MTDVGNDIVEVWAEVLFDFCGQFGVDKEGVFEFAGRQIEKQIFGIAPQTGVFWSIKPGIDNNVGFLKYLALKMR